MGIDVGNVLHIKINHVDDNGKIRSVYIGTLPYSDSMEEIREIKMLWKQFRCKAGVIDGMPEIRLARRMCAQIPGFFRWQHVEGTKDIADIQSKIVKTERNLLLDDVKESIITQKLVLPKNAKRIGKITDKTKGLNEYYDNMTAPVRTWDQDRNKGRGAYIWKETRPDHFAFAEGYAILAKNVLISLGG